MKRFREDLLIDNYRLIGFDRPFVPIRDFLHQ